MKHFNKIFALFVVCLGMFSCADDYDCDLAALEKPEDVANSEYLSKFDVLKAYVQDGSFGLATGMNAAALSKKDVAYSTLLTNFNAVDINGSFTPLNTLTQEGTYDFSAMQTAAGIAAEAPITMFGGVLCSEQGQRAAYYNQLIEPIEIPVQNEEGKTKLFNFDDDAIGTSYPMTGGSSATVEDDPAGESGHVLHVGTDAQKAAYSYAKMHVVLPEGRKLGDYVRINFDLRHVNSDGIYGGGMNVLINGNAYGLGCNAASLGAANNTWKRGLVIDLKGQSTPGFVLPEAVKDLTEFDLSIGSASGSAQYFLDNISMEYEVAGEGTTKVNFEDEAIGTTHKMTGGGSSEVVEDPKGTHGHVLSIKQASYGLPIVHVKLKDGMTLSAYSGVQVDMYIESGQWGAGAFMNINGTQFSLGTNLAGLGINPDGSWHDGALMVTFVKEGTYTASGQSVPARTIEIPKSMEKLTEIDFAIGSHSGNWTGMMDNLVFTWKAQPTIIEKTDAEKAELFTQEMQSYIGGMINAGVTETSAVKMWNIIGEPLSTNVDDNTFSWKDYLGEPGWVQTAVKLARDTASVLGTDLDLFVSQTIEQGSDMGQKAQDLVAKVASWENGSTKIDGLNVLLHATYSMDPAVLEQNEQDIASMLQALAQSGKRVLISDLSVSVKDANGNDVTAANLTYEETQAVAQFMTYIIRQYRTTVPQDKQYGISLERMAETNGSSKVFPWTQQYNRNAMYEGMVNGLTDSAN